MHEVVFVKIAMRGSGKIREKGMFTCRKGQLCKQVRSISTKSGRTNKTMLSYIADDLGIRLCFGPAGPHVLTLDNIYVGSKNDRKTLRIFLKENPEYIAKVFYLTFGIWDTDDEAQATA